MSETRWAWVVVGVIDYEGERFIGLYETEAAVLAQYPKAIKRHADEFVLDDIYREQFRPACSGREVLDDYYEQLNNDDIEKVTYWREPVR